MTAHPTHKQAGGFTGWHMLGIMLAFFGTIIAVNSLMAYYASSSWSGILAKNTYVASQEFNIKAAEARQWAKQGFRGELKVDGDLLTYRLQGPAGAVDRLSAVSVIFHRPVGEQQDFTLTLRRTADGAFSAQHALASGQWIADVAAIEDGKTIFHQAGRLNIAGRAP